MFSRERNAAILENVNKMLEVNFIRKVLYASWVANVIFIKNHETHVAYVLTSLI